jgi:hypothetical protein
VSPRPADDRPHTVFVSASIPAPERKTNDFDPFAITDAVVATARAIFTRGGIVLTAAHPTIAPLVLQVADDFPADTQPTMVILYQSDLFEEVIPPATREMMERPYVHVEWTPKTVGEAPEPGRWAGSLATMRQQMMSEVPIAAAVFVGGMEGIRDEHDIVRREHPEARRMALRRPGGEAAALADLSDLRPDLVDSDLYPWVMDQAMDEVLGPPLL